MKPWPQPSADELARMVEERLESSLEREIERLKDRLFAVELFAGVRAGAVLLLGVVLLKLT